MSDVLSGSHIPILAKLIKMTEGPVLELGMGYSSTPLLHWLCKAQTRVLESLENDKKWLSRFDGYRSHLHDIELVEDWDKAAVIDDYWSVVLIDHRPALRRKEEARRLKDKASYVILHDSEPEIDKFYKYTWIYPLFKYRFDYKKVGKPYTTVLSNFYELDLLNEV